MTIPTNEAVARADIDDPTVWNVTYHDKRGYPVVTVGCETRDDANALASLLNRASWVDVDVGETV